MSVLCVNCQDVWCLMLAPSLSKVSSFTILRQTTDIVDRDYWPFCVLLSKTVEHVSRNLTSFPLADYLLMQSKTCHDGCESFTGIATVTKVGRRLARGQFQNVLRINMITRTDNIMERLRRSHSPLLQRAVGHPEWGEGHWRHFCFLLWSWDERQNMMHL